VSDYCLTQTEQFPAYIYLGRIYT